MTKPRLVSVCTGYGGLEMGLALAGVGFELAAVADTGEAASKLLAYRHPDVPNLGDLRQINWERLEADIVTGGFPCQPVSAAGRGAGINDERWLFDDIAAGIGRMGTRPRLLVFENVRGLLTANRGAAMGRVVEGLARLGYVGRYRVHRASDVGAPHRRARVFILAWLPGTDPADRIAAAPGSPVLTPAGPLLKTPTAQLAINGGSQHPDKRKAGGHGPTLADQVEHLLPTPTASRSGRQRSASPNAAVRPSLDMITTLLPTPRATDGAHGGPNQHGSSGDLMMPSAVFSPRWGEFDPAIRRWERIFGQPAPAPTEPNRTGGQRLAARFIEWMLGVEAGHVTDVPGLTRSDHLGLLGNGIQPQQLAAAVHELMTDLNHARINPKETP